MICDLTCSPHQSKFMKATDVRTNDGKVSCGLLCTLVFYDIPIVSYPILTINACNFEKKRCFFLPTDKKYIQQIQLYLTKKYMDEAYRSCETVGFLMGKAISMICGVLSDCNSVKFFKSMGESSLAPFEIIYTRMDKAMNDIEPLNPEAIPCNLKIGVSFFISSIV